MISLASSLVMATLLAQATEAPPTATTPAGDQTLIRVDLEDGFALHPWLYHERRINDVLGLMVDVHGQTRGQNGRFPEFAELDIGPNWHLGNLQVNPQLGVDLAWKSGVTGGHTKFADLLPQLYLLYNDGFINAESWNVLYLPFTKGAAKMFQARLLASLTLPGGVSVGPHGEATWIEDLGWDRKAVGGDVALGGSFGQAIIFLADELTRDVLEIRITYLRAF